MFENKNAGGWALALVALGLFIGLVLRDLIRKDNPPEAEPMIATMLPQPDEPPRNLDDFSERFERVTTQCSPFIVTLHGTFHEGQPQIFSGVLMSPEGFILTSAHRIGEAKQIRVTLSNKKEFIGEVLGFDHLIDLAVVKIAAKGLKSIRQGNSDDLRLGQWVIALGKPAFDRHAASAGIISVKGRSNIWLAEEEDFLQTDAVINASNVGGALVDLQGRLVGLNLTHESTSTQSRQMNFVVPVNMAREVMRSIIAEGRFVRGAVALQTQELDPSLASVFHVSENSGVLLSEILDEDMNATLAVQRGDILIKWGDKKVTNHAMLREFVAATKPGTTMPITIVRSGVELLRAITVLEARTVQDERKLESITPTTPLTNSFGVLIEPLTPELLHEKGLAFNTHGVFVSTVLAGSAAERAGICRGDIIQEWEGKNVINVKECRARMAASAAEQRVLVYVRRGKQTLYCALEVIAPAGAGNAL